MLERRDEASPATPTSGWDGFGALRKRPGAPGTGSDPAPFTTFMYDESGRHVRSLTFKRDVLLEDVIVEQQLAMA